MTKSTPDSRWTLWDS